MCMDATGANVRYFESVKEWCLESIVSIWYSATDYIFFSVHSLFGRIFQTLVNSNIHNFSHFMLLLIIHDGFPEITEIVENERFEMNSKYNSYFIIDVHYIVRLLRGIYEFFLHVFNYFCTDKSFLCFQSSV